LVRARHHPLLGGSAEAAGGESYASLAVGTDERRGGWCGATIFAFAQHDGAFAVMRRHFMVWPFLGGIKSRMGSISFTGGPRVGAKQDGTLQFLR